MDYQEQVRSEKIAKVRALEAAVGDIAKAMGPEWIVKKMDSEWGHHAEIEDDTGHSININNSWKDGRYTLSGNYPHDAANRSWDYARQATGYNTALPSITVANTKTGEQIAADIRRRLMPEYRAIVAKCLELQAASHAHWAKVRANVERIHTAAGPLATVQGDQKDKVHLYRNEGGYFDVSVNADLVSMEIRQLPIEKAEAVIRLLMAD